ncbi:putative rRNA maturation factor [Rhodobacter aestuarii]|uniref:Endoribonuclease YbeY n=1 Tax=Rhodobacter aestuarii TaxID=453582 RepID=A0A1N7PCT7_9RHOB|nr:rRNA maturation RNase YbeY [Rhodobacter aestuarii]PTV97740.1 putative rRNA maturation factor [Rhodobacter aestuarii]SIT08337.1 probable rRNA maturation factor [Rhodobacter aestuarii]
MQIEVDIEDPRWESLDLAARSEVAARAVLADLGVAPEGVTLSVLGCDDARIAELNEEFRGKPTPTNVLSWPAEERGAEAPGGVPERPVADVFGEIELGDIAIAYETCAREAQEAGKSVHDHVTHLMVHGVLHLLGYDHIRDADAQLMESCEVRILAALGISNPYEL